MQSSVAPITKQLAPPPWVGRQRHQQPPSPRLPGLRASPGDIHRVRNIGGGIAVSLHVYGADITRLGSSIRRTYDLPVATAS